MDIMIWETFIFYPHILNNWVVIFLSVWDRGFEVQEKEEEEE